jgi:5-methylcytosine-specific restriction protein B
MVKYLDPTEPIESSETSEPEADRIRRYAFENYVLPARNKGTKQVDIRVSDIYKALNLSPLSCPNICQALGGKKFQELAQVLPPMRIGADVSPATIFRFDISTAALTDDDILARFNQNSNFKAAQQSWDAVQSAAFCDVARAVHALGLDWWYVNIPPWQIRFGRKSPGQTNASGVLGYLNPGGTNNSPHIDFNEDAIKHFGDDAIRSFRENALNFDLGSSDFKSQRFVETLKKWPVTTWKALKSERRGGWPDEGQTGLFEPATSTEGIEAVIAPTPTNLILYGPPGTGKTFSTAAEAVRLCDGALPDGGVEAIRRRYEELTKARQIQFVTFHQSYSYEDFVEGLRPTTAGDEEEDSSGAAVTAGFRLKPVAGVFREIATLAEQARKAAADGRHGGDFDLTGRQFWKMGLGAIGSDDHVYSSAIAGGYVALGWGADVDWSDPRFANYVEMQKEWAARYPDDHARSQTAQPWVLRNQIKRNDIIIVPYGNSAFRAIGEVVGDYYFNLSEDGSYNHRRAVRWILTLDEPLPLDTIIDGNFTMRTLYNIPEHRLRKEALSRLLSGLPATSGPRRPDQFVLIIDEINRANISKVFGELITLIEPDKRIGEAYELKATLPYSKMIFGVPNNLHIIGTMNTADRSIALLDTALRRRFEFRELMPQPEKLGTVDGINLGQILTVINERVEYLFDRDHQIGHSFFMSCNSREDIDNVMRLKVIPLLAEYFYDDSSKVAAVLGDVVVEEDNYNGSFFDRRLLKPPVGLNADANPERRYRWQIREAFDYQKLK